MALTEGEYDIISAAREADVLPPKPVVLQIGEANWYGDVPIKRFVADIRRIVTDEARQEKLIEELENEVLSEKNQYWSFDLARMFYRVFLDYESIEAIDMQGTPAARRLDLNRPIHPERQFDVVLCIGTVEHVFNVGQAFRTIHELTAPDGIILVAMPFTGWLDHGFYSFQPTFYFDLAAANGYGLHTLVYCELNPYKVESLMNRQAAIKMAQEKRLGENSALYAMFRKPGEEKGFQPPIQGYYAGALSKEARDAWDTMR